MIIFIDKIKEKTLIDFIKEFPDEESCKQKFKEYREHVDVSCRKCGGTDSLLEKRQRTV